MEPENNSYCISDANSDAQFRLIMEQGRTKTLTKSVKRLRLVSVVLSALLLFSVIRYFGSLSEVDDLNSRLESASQDSYEEGYSSGKSTGYESGYDAGTRDAYATGYDEGLADGISKHLDEVRFFRNHACIVTTTGSKYHHYGCPHIDYQEYYIYNIENAEYQGYTPCLDCWQEGLLGLFIPSSTD